MIVPFQYSRSYSYQVRNVVNVRSQVYGRLVGF